MKKKKKKLMMTRRQVLKAGMIGGAGLMLPLRFLPAKAFAADPTAACNILGCTNYTLSDPALQLKFVNLVPDAMAPGFMYKGTKKGKFNVEIGPSVQWTGLMNGGAQALTPVWGYGQKGRYTWPGKTFEVQSGSPVEVMWKNKLLDAAGRRCSPRSFASGAF